MVLEDLWAKIEREFPLGPQLPEQWLGGLEMQPAWGMRHATPAFYVRLGLQKALARAVKLGQPSALHVLGRPGAGVTTLLAAACRDAMRVHGTPGDLTVKGHVSVAAYFATLGPLAPQPAAVLSSLCWSLKMQLGLPWVVPTGLNALKSMLIRAMVWATARKQRVLLLIDGITEVFNPQGIRWCAPLSGR